ncbi:MAG: HD-GYP domain-containing protein [Lachnospiraceae bacterium]|nr:HD-GYP domain-containing protein [Lachnospiraceae bacterium]
MVIDQTIVDKTGRALIEKGALLDDFQIEGLLRHGIMEIYIREGEADPEPEEEIVISQAVQNTIQKVRVEDRARVKLTESVKKRVSEGIQYLYSNSADAGFAEASNAIAGELMKAVAENDAIAVDIGALKVSDEYTFKHSVDVATMAMVVAKKHGLSEEDVREVGIAGLLHDMGKCKIPNEVLNKPARLTDEEFHLMKQHALFGYQILKEKNQFNDKILLGVLQHHEKLNGRGYPMGVGPEKIHLYARIISVADIYDALVTERPYKKGFSQRDAIEMIMAMTEELDIEVMRSFLSSVILYPVDSIVTLSNGEKAKVVENHANYVLRPTVVGIKSGKVYNLSEDVGCASILIM